MNGNTDAALADKVVVAEHETLHQNAMALLAAAADPDGTRDRLNKLREAIQEHNSAREAANTRMFEVEEGLRIIESSRAELAERETALQQRVEAAEAAFKKREVNVRVGEAEHAAARASIAERTQQVTVRESRVANSVQILRQYLNALDGAQ